MSSEALVPSVGVRRSADAARTDRYFLGVSIFLFTVVLIGFSRTLFLRPLFQVPAVPWYVYIHGSVMTMWFALLVAQTSLVAAHRTDVHRRLGILGAVLAVAVVILGIATTLGTPAHFKAGGATSAGTPNPPQQVEMLIMFGNIGRMMLFPILVATALGMRRRPEVHKRLMLLASMAIIAPAMARIQGFAEVGGISLSPSVGAALLHIIPAIIVFLLPLTLVGHDLLTTRRLHRATVWGVLAYFVVGFVMNVVVPVTALGRTVWNALL
ncbi:MAG TPA: hypothetical protein VIY90_15995 [Steroidobacteraceae bacterium]